MHRNSTQGGVAYKAMPMAKPVSFRSSLQAPAEKTFDSSMSRELENTNIPQMQMMSAMTKSPISMQAEKSRQENQYFRTQKLTSLAMPPNKSQQ